MTTDAQHMAAAIAAASQARLTAPPNPWVGCVIVSPDGHPYVGFTQAPGGNHAEIEALAAAGEAAWAGTAYVTLEPCVHHGRTAPCADALMAAGIDRVVIATSDPDPRVAGRGIELMRDAGVQVEVGLAAADVERQLAPYLHQRLTGRPFVVLKLALSLDGRLAAPDGSSEWITGAEARMDAHGLRAESDALVVGAGTIRTDDPRLTVRDIELPPGLTYDDVSPRRLVLGSVPPDAAAQPCEELRGELPAVLDQLGAEEVLQLMVEGGPTVAGEFHRAGLVDRYVLYLAPVLFGGEDATPAFSGRGAPTIDEVWRGRLVEAMPLGADLKVVVEPRHDR